MVYQFYCMALYHSQTRHHMIKENIHNYTLKHSVYSKTCVKPSLKNRQNKDLNDKWKRNEG